MKYLTYIVVAAVFLLLGIQFAIRASQTKAYIYGQGAMPAVDAKSYSPEHLYGGNRQFNSPQSATPADTLGTNANNNKGNGANK